MTLRKTTVALALAILLAAVALDVWLASPLPAGMFAPDDGSGVTIRDRNGLTLRSTRAADGSRAQWVRYDDIDADLINAFVVVEDRRFWDHAGVDLRALGRASLQNLRARRVVSGASTITMQLARLVRPSPRRLGGKVTQALWALRIERHAGKQEILEQYLNRVHLGQAAVGVGAASKLYFATSASTVSIGQAATLAGLAHAPSRDNPYVSPKRSAARRALALRRMQRSGFASSVEIQRAGAEPLIAKPRVAPFLAPHFTTRVLDCHSERSEGSEVSQVGIPRCARDDIETSLDLTLQREVEAEVRHTVDVMRDRNVRHAAAVVLDNETGEVLAWVGSPDFWTSPDGQTDMVVSPRQPGSALKPFLYALALDRGYTAASVLPDIPRAFATGTGAYQPRNYDRKFRGPVRAREALASSYNVPAVELASRMGTGSLLHTLRLAGFESLERNAEHYGLGLALGNGDVALIEIANGYRALANGGEWRPWTWRAVPEKSASPSERRRVVSRQASAIVLDILRDPAARIPGFGLVTPFDFPFPVAVKTGTSRHFTDNWAVGTTRRFTVAVWAGNFDGRPMQGVSGVTGAGPLLHRVVVAVSKRFPPGELVTPAEAGATAVPICRLSGMRATPACAQLTEWFVPGTEPREADSWERDGRISLPGEYAEWGGAAQMSVTGERPSVVAWSDSVPDTAPAPERFRVVSPRDGDRYSIPVGPEAEYATISLRATGAENVRWSVDGRPYTKGRWRLSPGEHEIVATSATGESAKARILVDQ